MNVLFLSRWFPYPPDNGSKIRAFNLIRRLSLRHEVDLISFTSEMVAEERLAVMRRRGRRADSGRRRGVRVAVEARIADPAQVGDRHAQR